MAGKFYLNEKDKICITDGSGSSVNLIDGIKWAEFNRPSHLNKQVKICENFVCKKYNMGIGSKCNDIPCNEYREGNCESCKLYLSQSISCENCKIW